VTPKLRRPSHATIVAYLALFVALGGTSAYAVNEWTGANIVDGTITGADIRGQPASGGSPAVGGSIQAHDLADGAIRTAKIANGQVNGDKVADSSLTGADVADTSLTGDDVQNGSISGADVDEFSLSAVPNAWAIDGHGIGDLVTGGGETINGRMDVSPGNSDLVDVGLGRVQLNCSTTGHYYLAYWHQSAAVGHMDVFWRNIDGVGHQRVVNLGAAAQLTPVTQRTDMVTVHAAWSSDWTPTDLVNIGVRWDADAGKCIAIYRSIWSLN
jgi:hypothetical protein